MSAYRVLIVREDGSGVKLHPGSLGERNLVKSVVDKAVAKGVGLFRTESAVRAAIQAAFDEVLHDIKKEVKP
jgi:hypothetical protein